LDSLDPQAPDRKHSTRAVLARALKRARGSLLMPLIARLTKRKGHK